MAATRIYRVRDMDAEGEDSRLIEATSPSQAVRHAAKRFNVAVASAKEVASLMARGLKVELAKEPE